MGKLVIKNLAYQKWSDTYPVGMLTITKEYEQVMSEGPEATNGARSIAQLIKNGAVVTMEHRLTGAPNKIGNVYSTVDITIETD